MILPLFFKQRSRSRLHLDSHAGITRLRCGSERRRRSSSLSYLTLAVLLLMFLAQGRAAEAINDGSGELVPVAAFVDEKHRTRTSGSQVYDREKKPIRIGVTVLEKGLGVAIQEK
ncbi:hypothetical protein SASPL_105792 [Salvia splendens]|uniref:Uncharacterized protein n=1 Tax=Salvia splendens TaxID=180675 RepID=A0A8X8YM28_SALSN|nr:hypothetical protein SASPL_105792 [Salvia splendens]